MADYYTGSKGPVDITTMHPSHLISAIAKLERTDPDSEELPAMRDLAAKHKAEWDAQQEGQD